MLPAFSTTVEPLEQKNGFDVVYVDGGWQYVEVPVPEEEPQSEEPQPEPYVPTYADLRREAYPDVGDQLDALWKGGAEAEAMKEKIMAVKTKYPKA